MIRRDKLFFISKIIANEQGGEIEATNSVKGWGRSRVRQNERGRRFAAFLKRLCPFVIRRRKAEGGGVAPSI